MYTQYIIPRIYVSQTHPSEKLCTPRAYFHHLTCVTYKYGVHMRCHHKNLIIDFEIYFMPGYISNYQMINNIDIQIQILNSQFCSHRKLDFIIIISSSYCLDFASGDYSSLTHTCFPKPGHSHTTFHLYTNLDQPNS